MSASILLSAPPTLIAHRGYSGKYPENTLIAYQAAYQHGARWVELDCQLSQDLEPIVHHDASLKRMTGYAQDIRDTRLADIKKLPAMYPERFGDQYKDNRFSTLEEFCTWVNTKPDLTVFVEVKQESIDRFGVATVMDEILQRILATDTESQYVIISFNSEVLDYARANSSIQVGWVLPAWNEHNQQIAMRQQPEFLFCDVESLPEDDAQVWQGSWHWALYNLDTVESAVAMANRGFAYLETNEIGTLMADARLRPD